MLNMDTFLNIINFLGASDIANCCPVSKTWRSAIDGPEGHLGIWKSVSIRDGVPIVEGNRASYKDDFAFLHPITISGRIIGQYLGKVVGEVPHMSADRFAELSHARDLFEPQKLQRNTHVVLVDPATLKITVSPSRPLALDDSQTLVEVPQEEQANMVKQELTVPFSFKNLKMLATYPIVESNYGPVFNPDSHADVFDQCNNPSDQNRLLIMRREVVGRRMPVDGERGANAEVINRGLKVVTVRQRAFFKACPLTKFQFLNRVRYTDIPQ